MTGSRQLPRGIRTAIRQARLERGWSQSVTGRRAGLTQKHISEIESGGVVPRFDTLLELARALDLDLVIVPRSLAATVKAMAHDLANPEERSALLEPLFADQAEEDLG